MSCRSLRASTPLFATIYKRPLKEGLGLFVFAMDILAWAFGAWVLLGFGLGFGLILLLWAFWCGKLLVGKRITEGKRIAKGKLLKGKVWLKRS
jgi:hypothetical protein